jgi:hypothetical protein
MKAWQRVCDLPGVLARDVPRYVRALADSGARHKSDRNGWISLCNRIERTTPDGDGKGVVCDWRWGSDLHAAQVLPFLGRRLMAAALSEWPVLFADQPSVVADSPKLSFVFAHCGNDRLPQLIRTIRSIYGQSEIPCECIVVDQSPTPLLGQLPSPIVYRHLGKDGVPAGWHKSWAYNVGARLARGSIIVFHDGDVCAPNAYASEVVNAIDRRGFAAASLQRLLFYLSHRDTLVVEQHDAINPGLTPTVAHQNWKGGTIAVSRDALFALGGFDEGFVDWGGEDDEFYDRCGSLRHCRSGFLPFVHLWHPPQSGRRSVVNPNIADVMPWRMSLPCAERVDELGKRHWGDVSAPDPLSSYKMQRAAILVCAD